MNKFKMTVAVAAMTVLAGPALAGTWSEPVVETPPAPPMPTYTAHNWTGAYVGAGLGWSQWTRSGGMTEPLRAENPDLMLNDSTISGLTYSGFVGYNQQLMNGMVLGAEAELGGFQIEDFDVDYMARLKGRLGFAMDNVLVYGTGGAAYIAGDGDSAWGWTGGLGVEVAMDGNWFIGAEATHTRFDNVGPFDTTWTANMINARVGFRF